MTTTFTRALSIAKEIKALKDIPVVLGGIHATAMPRDVLSNKEIDYVIIGEGEYAFAELAKAIENKSDLAEVNGLGYKNHGKISINKPRGLIENLDALPLPARHLLPKWYFDRWMVMRGHWLKGTNMMSARGCVYNCSYCASKVMFGRRLRFISPNRVVDEIEHLIRHYGIDAITFSDDTFSIDKKGAIEICNEIKRRKLKAIKFRVQLRANTVSDELLKSLKDAGCIQVDIGVESGSQRILDILNKNITVEQVRTAFKLFKKYSLYTCATFMIGNPTETMDDIEMTRNLAREIKADYAQFFITTPYPGTKLYEDIVKTNEAMSFDKLHHGGDELTSYVDSKVPIKELIELQKKLNEEFLRKAGMKMISPLLAWDTFALILQRPGILKEALLKFKETKRITDIYRIFYEGHDSRK